jgi:hypothetical protein
MKIKAWYIRDTGDTGAVLFKNKATDHDVTVWIPRSQILYMKKLPKMP